MKRGFYGRIILTALAVISFAGCQFGLEPENSDNAVDEFVDIFDVSYELELQGASDPSASVAGTALFEDPGISGSATMSEDDLATPLAAGESRTVTDYPEPGLQTLFSVEEAGDVGTADLLKVTGVTTAMNGFEGSFLPERTVEIYYIDDSTGTTTDALDAQDAGSAVHPNATGYDWSSLYREEFADYFADGSVRRQFVVNNANLSASYAPFDINGSMEFPQAAIDGTGYAPPSQAGAQWSSMVVYRHPLERTFNFWFLTDTVRNPTIIGVRYYTEFLNSSGQTVGTSYAIEVVYGVVGGTVESIAQNVIRKEVVFEAGSSRAISRSARMQMVIENQVGGENVVVGKNGKDISRLPPRAQEAQLRQIQRAAQTNISAEWGDIEIMLQ